jgi:hypothetical protein
MVISIIHLKKPRKYDNNMIVFYRFEL